MSDLTGRRRVRNGEACHGKHFKHRGRDASSVTVGQPRRQPLFVMTPFRSQVLVLLGFCTITYVVGLRGRIGGGLTGSDFARSGPSKTSSHGPTITFQ